MDYLINKLNKVQWTSFTAHKMTAEGTVEGCLVTLDIQCQFSTIAQMSPLRISAIIYIDGVHAAREDINNTEDMDILRKWYVMKMYDTGDAQREAKDDAHSKAEAIFKNL
jgi:hypothetical protein